MSARTAVSLFAGVGGIDLGLERAGFHVTSAVEIDDQARGVLADRFPRTTLHSDVTKVTSDDLRADGFVPDRGLLAAGFPCQDLSVAGRRKGMGDGTRSGLYWHVVRLLAGLRPRWVLLENVPGLLSACCPCVGDGRCEEADCPGELHPVEGGACGPGRCMVEHGGAMGAVLGSLGELGYGFAYRVLDAQHFGVPQRRRRVFIVGCLGDDRRPVEVLLEPEGRAGNPDAGHPARSGPAADLGYGLGVAGRSCGVANTLVARDENGAQIPAEGGTMVVSTLQGGGKRGYRIDAEGAADGHLIPFQKVTRPATSDHPDVWEHRSTAATLSPFDLGSETRAVELVVGVLGHKAHTLTAEGHDASEDGTGRGTPVVAFHQTQDPISGPISPALGAQSIGMGVHVETTVRRLTPRECERLQGFPDDHTATSNGRPQSDGPRYRQMGNAVAVPVAEWVARRIVESDDTAP